MMIQYVNGFNLNLNEVAILEFRINAQSANNAVAQVAMLYPFLKEVHKAIGDAIEQHDKKLGELQQTKANMN